MYSLKKQCAALVLVALLALSLGQDCFFFGPDTECEFQQNTDFNRWKITPCLEDCCDDSPLDNVFSVCIHPEAMGGGATFAIVPPKVPIKTLEMSIDLCQMDAELQIYLRYDCKPDVPVLIFSNGQDIQPLTKFNFTTDAGCGIISQIEFFGYLRSYPDESYINLDELCYDFTTCNAADCPVKPPPIGLGCQDPVNCQNLD